MFLDEKRCAICGKSEEYIHLDPHHKIKQSAGGKDEDIVWLCREHHNWVEDNPNEAEKLGLHIRQYRIDK